MASPLYLIFSFQIIQVLFFYIYNFIYTFHIFLDLFTFFLILNSYFFIHLFLYCRVSYLE